MPDEDVAKVKNHAFELGKRGIKVTECYILTNKISLFVVDDDEAWAFYPKTKCTTFIGFRERFKGVDEFSQKCIDEVLNSHNWFDEEVAKQIASRKGGNYRNYYLPKRAIV
jgi:hypothetical protein